jgi:hypothetical protein
VVFDRGVLHTFTSRDGRNAFRRRGRGPSGSGPFVARRFGKRRYARGTTRGCASRLATAQSCQHCPPRPSDTLRC